MAVLTVYSVTSLYKGVEQSRLYDSLESLALAKAKAFKAYDQAQKELDLAKSKLEDVTADYLFFTRKGFGD